MEEAFRKHENLDAWKNTGLFFAETSCLPKYSLKSLLIHGIFGLQQQALIATADARFTVVYVSLNFFREGKVLFLAFFSPRIGGKSLDSAFHILGGVGNVRERKKGRQEIAYLYDCLCYHFMH